MTKVTFLGGEEVGNVGFIEWPVGPPGNQQKLIFPLNKAVEVKDAHVLKKIRGQVDKGWWRIEEDDDTKKSGHGTGAHGGAGAKDEEENGDESAPGTLKQSTRARKIP